MKNLSSARKYAKALFNQALGRNELRAAQQGLEEGVRVARLRASVLRGLAHPFIGLKEKQSMVRSVLGEYATPLLERFMDMLIARGRVGLLCEIEKEFQVLVDRHQGIEPVTIRSAFALPAAQQKELEKVLEKRLSAKVRMSVQVDPTLIGGLVIQTRDHVIDESIRGKLKRLEGQLIY